MRTSCSEPGWGKPPGWASGRDRHGRGRTAAGWRHPCRPARRLGIGYGCGCSRRGRTKPGHKRRRNRKRLTRYIPQGLRRRLHRYRLGLHLSSATRDTLATGQSPGKGDRRARSVGGRNPGPRRGELRRLARRTRGAWLGPCNERATPPGAANHLGPPGWARFGADASLHRLPGRPARAARCASPGPQIWPNAGLDFCRPRS